MLPGQLFISWALVCWKLPCFPCIRGGEELREAGNVWIYGIQGAQFVQVDGKTGRWLLLRPETLLCRPAKGIIFTWNDLEWVFFWQLCARFSHSCSSQAFGLYKTKHSLQAGRGIFSSNLEKAWNLHFGKIFKKV